MVHSAFILMYVWFVSLAPMAVCLKPSIRSRARWWPSSRFLSSLICRRSSRRFPSCSSVTGKKKTTSCHLCFLTLFFLLGGCLIPAPAPLFIFTRLCQLMCLTFPPSPYVVKYYGSYFKNTDLWIVMEYCGAGSVSDIIRLRNKTVCVCIRFQLGFLW